VNVAGQTQDIVIGVLLLGAILAGNLIRAAQANRALAGRLYRHRKEVVGHDQVDSSVPNGLET